MARRSSTEVTLDPSMRIVVFHGKDPFLLRERERLFVEMLEEAHGEVGRFAFDGTSCQLADVLDELRSFGLLHRHKLVILDQAEQFLADSGGQDTPRRSTRRAAMERYAAEPMPDATLVMRATTWRPGKLDKLIAKVGAIVKCDPPHAGKAVNWCIDRCRKRLERTLDRDAAALLVERIGPNLMRLDQEIAKLAASVGSEPRISRDDVVALVGPSREEQVWVLQSALLSGRPGVALGTLRELRDVSGVAHELIHWAVCDLVRKLHAAAQMARQGASAGQIASELRLWGDTKPVILSTSAHAGPEPFAQLLQRAVRMDQRSKTGRADPARSLEALTLLVADSIACA